MNWDLIKWFAGLMATLAGIKFVMVFFKTLVSKETMRDALDVMGDKIHDAGESASSYLKRKSKERKMRKEQEEKPIVVIR